MNVRPLSGRVEAIRDALLSHGWEGDLAPLTSGGIETAAFHVTGVDSSTIETMLAGATRLGLEIVTGDDWLIFAGARARLGAFARPWLQPESVQPLAYAVGTALPDGTTARWRHAEGELTLDAPVIVGVINATPDSFSDGGHVHDVESALQSADELIDGGATILDIGGESTRPGSRPLAGDEEAARVLPIFPALRARFPDVPLSIDTVHADTAARALDAGAVIVNDVTAGRHDPALPGVAAGRGAGLVLSHSRGALGTLASYQEARYQNDITGGVVADLQASVAAARAAGVADATIVVDPGFGFSKTAPQSLALLWQLDALVRLGFPVMVGVSRKRFLGAATGRDLGDRDRATAAACALAYERGARIFRVHDPGAVRDALQVAAAAQRAGSSPGDEP